MTELFLTVLQMSLMAAGVTVIALPLRWLFRRLRLPALACVLLWLVVAVRMLLPVGLVTGPFSVLGWLTPAVQEQTEALARTEEIVLLPAVPDPAPPAAPDPGFALPEAVPAPEEAAPAAEGLSVLDVLAWLWLAGVLAVWGYMALAWLRLRRRLATAVWRGSAQMGWWWESDRIPTAFVFGFFTPRVYVPAGLEGETLRWVLLHERAHIKLGHHRYKAVYFLLAGLHWFNPMLWLSWVLLGRDLEVACDEKVLGSACGSPREYSAALLALASPNRGPLLPPGFGETGVKDRIRRALKWKPAAPWMAAVLFVLAVALGLLLLNDPPFPDPTVNGQYPTLRIQMEQDGPGGAGGETVVNMGVPEAATWPEELPEAERTASTPRPWVSLYLNNGAFPSRWTMTEYLVENGQAVAEFLEQHPKVAYVNYPGLPSNKYYERAKKYMPDGGCGVVSFGLKGGREAASVFMQNLKLGAIETHVADARTCCLNPATSTHRQMNDEQLKEAGVPAELIRISLGLEDKEDLIADISAALDAIQ